MGQDDDGRPGLTLATVLARHMRDRGRNLTELAEEARVPKATLHRWLSGKSVSPYYADGLLQVAAALQLTRAETNHLLRAAGLPGIAAMTVSHPERRAMLARWQARAPNNLPAELTSFVGRDDEVVAIAERLTQPDVRLVTLTGPGGSGKTRLALRLAAEVLDVFNDGVTFVPLADVTDPTLVMAEVGRALGLAQATGTPPIERVAAWLASRRVLLVLDNLEQIVECGPALVALLRAAPAVTIMATSRVSLGVTGEHRWPIRPLPLPRPDLPVRELAANPAVGLFIQRAQAADPDFTLSATTAPAVVALCNRLDGLPLAIELVAARSGDFDLAELVTHVPDTLSLASGGPRDAALRQRALREAIAWSERLLPPAAQRLFARLGLPHGWDKPLAVAIAAGPDIPASDIPNLLAILADASLVERQDDDVAPRYRMLATIREYALERLDALGERETVAERHARAMLALAEDAPPYVPQALRAGWFPRVDRERLNFDAALAWTNQAGETLLLAQLTAALWPYWHEYRLGVAGRRWLDACLATVSSLPDELGAMLLTGACILEVNQADTDIAMAHAAEALSIWRQLNDPRGQALILPQVGWVHIASGDFAATVAAYTEALEQWQLAGDERGIALALGDLGMAQTFAGQFDAALQHLRRELEVVEPTGDPLGIGRAHTDLGLHALLSFNPVTALEHLREAVAHLSTSRPSFQLAVSQLYLATSLCLIGQIDEAEAIYGALLQIQERAGDRFLQSLVILGHAAVAHRRNNGHDAAWLCGVATTLQGPSGLAPMATIQTLYEHETQLIVAQIGTDAFAAAYARGAAVPAGQALTAVRGTIAHTPGRNALESQ